MRTMRLPAITAAIVIISLASGPPAAGQSQEPLDPMRWSSWTGTFSGTGGSAGEQTDGPDYTELLGAMAHGDLAADDPRVTGTLTQLANVRAQQLPCDLCIGVVNGTARIDNDEGAWVGTYVSYGGSSGQEEWYELTGEGAYEGLTTVFSWRSGDNTYSGVIVPFELPPLPEPIPPPAG